jgi:hypothetical protein
MMPRMRLLSKPDPLMAFLRQLRRSAPSRRSLLPSLVRGTLFGLLLFGLSIGLRVAIANNVHSLQSGRVYRAAQMDPERLKQFAHDHRVRTVVNLRGYCPDFDWYLGECRATHDANISQEDITLSALRLPAPAEVRRLLEVLDHAEYPILLHCRQGVDRTGLAAVMVKLLEPGVSLAEARRQLSLAFGYVPYNGTEYMDRFFDLYRDWLSRMDSVHTPELFRHWAQSEYCPGACRARVEWIDLPQGGWPANQGRMVHIRAHNTSVSRWVFRPGTLMGVHARYRVTDSDGRVVTEELAGQFEATVDPGNSIELGLGVPPLRPGGYSLAVDLIDVDENAFSQFGFDPLACNFRVLP